MNRILRLLAFLVFITPVAVVAQVQWYQQQDGQNQLPHGTFAASVQPLNSYSFIACYQWHIENDETTWKISRSLNTGYEANRFFVTGPFAAAEVRVSKNHSVYVLKKEFPQGENMRCTLYRLNELLQVKAQQQLLIPGDFSLVNLNCFELDGGGNVYLAGDGQYPDGPGYASASFVLRANKNFETQWIRMDSVQTSYTGLHVDAQQHVIVLEDFYTQYPAVKISRFGPGGALMWSRSVVPDANRYSLSSLYDHQGSLFLYGAKVINDTTDGVYLCRLSLQNGSMLYHKTMFTARATQLLDLKSDQQGNLYSLVNLFTTSGQLMKVSRWHSASGRLRWSRSWRYEDDSIQLNRLIVNSGNEFYALGDKKCHLYYAKAFARKISKNGQLRGILAAPDSTQQQRCHTLVDGFIDRQQRLISVGNTNDFDSSMNQSTYFRAFAVRYREEPCNQTTAEQQKAAETVAAELLPEDEESVLLQLRLFPNPVHQTLLVSNIPEGSYSTLRVLNVQGAQIYSQRITGSSQRIDVSRYENGIYIMQLESSNKLSEKSIKFIVRR